MEERPRICPTCKTNRTLCRACGLHQRERDSKYCEHCNHRESRIIQERVGLENEICILQSELEKAKDIIQDLYDWAREPLSLDAPPRTPGKE